MSDDAGRVFGIDLGTTYSAIAYVDEAGRPAVCRNNNNSETTPSVVYFETEDNVVVGQNAKESAFIDADNVVELIKRRMGHPETYTYHGKDYTPESISALILTALATDAANHTGGPVERVVVTVPAYFGVAEKKATENAGAIAELDVVGILPEPVAAAVHYDTISGGTEKTVLVYDLGGGTFDTTVIRVGASEISVICTDGHTNLGGTDWDARLRSHVIEKFIAEVSPEESPEDDPEFMQWVAIKVEDLKKQLSSQESRSIQLRSNGKAAKVEVTRAEFERITADLLDSTMTILGRTLDTLREKDPDAVIDEVLLVGGSTRMPAVAARLTQEHGWVPRLHDPDLAVAKGAALWGLSQIVFRMQNEAIDDVLAQGGTEAEANQAAARIKEQAAQQYGLSEAQFIPKQTTSVLPHAFGVKLQDRTDPDRDYVHHLAFANDRLPIRDKTLNAGTVVENQSSVEIEVYEQAGAELSAELEHNKPLNGASKVIEDIPPGPAGTPIDISMSITTDGLLEVQARERRSGHELTIRVNVGLSEQEVEAARAASSKIAVSS